MFCRCSHVNDLMIPGDVSEQVSGGHHGYHRGIMFCVGGCSIPEFSMRVETEFSS